MLNTRAFLPKPLERANARLSSSALDAMGSAPRPKTQTPIRAEKSRTLPIKGIGREGHGKPTTVKSVILKIPRQTKAAGSGVPSLPTYGVILSILFGFPLRCRSEVDRALGGL